MQNYTSSIGVSSTPTLPRRTHAREAGCQPQERGANTFFCKGRLYFAGKCVYVSDGSSPQGQEIRHVRPQKRLAEGRDPTSADGSISLAGGV